MGHADDRRHADPVADRRGRSSCCRAALAADLLRAAQICRGQAGLGKARPDPASDRTRARGLRTAGGRGAVAIMGQPRPFLRRRGRSDATNPRRENPPEEGREAGRGREARRLLIEAARRKKARKAGGAMQRVELNDLPTIPHPNADDLLALDEALTILQQGDEQAAEVAKLRMFGGLTVDQAAASLGISRATAFRHWAYVRAYLHLKLPEAASK
jgi:ECF sigma factor